MPSHSISALVTGLLSLLLTPTADALCECGYTINSTVAPNHALFTDVFETDFLHLPILPSNSTYTTGWLPQNYNTSAALANGPYGMAKQASNLVANYIEDPYDYSGPGVLGPGTGPGLQLWVHNTLLQPERGAGGKPLVSSAEIVSERDDILYGSFRVAMKTTGVDGTCGAFFVYRNDSQEVDVEILSSQQDGTTYAWPVHLVVQSTSTDPSLRALAPSVQRVVNLTANPPDVEYNEYRFDWLPDRVDYYINGHFVWSETFNVPSAAGRLHLSHWSNGNPYWSGGPPREDAVMSVSYVKAYFNSTNGTRQEDWKGSCGKGGLEGRMCEIPDQLGPPNPIGPEGNVTGRTFFFTKHAGMVANQTVYGPVGSSVAVAQRPAYAWMLAVLLSMGCLFVL